jgi:hypothetical protein
VPALAYELCAETDHAAARVLAHLESTACDVSTHLAAVQDCLETLARQGLMMAEEGRYLSLAWPG